MSKIHKKIYFNDKHQPHSIKIDDECKEKNYTYEINCFYLELKLIRAFGSTDIAYVPISLYNYYQGYWEILSNVNNIYSFGKSQVLKDTYDLFNYGITWFNVGGAELLDILMNSRNGIICGWFTWVKTGGIWHLSFISEERPDDFFN